MRYLGIWLLLLAGAEAASIVMVAERLGGMPTLLLMVLSFMAGMVMLRNLGFSSVMLAGSLFNSRGEVSFYQLLWPLRYIVAALLLMSPGFVSTALALLLMRPNQMGQNYRSSGYGADGDIIDGEFETVRPQEEREETRLLEQHDYKPPQ